MMHKRGSEWRKWDLHVHTPYTYMNSYTASDEDFIKKLVDNNISVVGLTNYFKFTDEEFSLKEKLETEGIKVFLNLELRLDYQNKDDENLDFHVIFSDEVSKQDIETFLQNISANVQGNNKKLANLATQDDFKYAVVSFDELLKNLNDESLNLKDKYLIGFLSRGKGNGRTSSNYEKLTSSTDFIIHSSDNPKNIEEDKAFWLTYKKPLIQSSDAHNLATIGNKFTWIKADKTFEGLKQITYEPEDRVCIQELKPEDKNNYLVIDKVQFIDNSFSPIEILLNQNLTTIIGGKSTGKSILLRNIAETIDSNEVASRLEEVGLQSYPSAVDDFSVTWKDTQESKKSDSAGINKKIIYIPQSYLDRLIDKKEDKTSIDKLIINILKQEDEIKNAFIELDDLNRELEIILRDKISTFFYKGEDLKTLKGHIVSIGDKKGIETEIEKIKLEVLTLKETSGLTDKELEEYDTLLKKYKELKEKENLYTKDLNLLNEIKNKEIVHSPFLDDLSDELKSILEGSFSELKAKYKLDWINTITQQITKIKENKVRNNHELDANKSDLHPLLEKVKESKALDEKIKKLSGEEEKYKVIISEEEKYNILLKEYQKIFQDIVENHSRFFDNLFQAKTKILAQKSITGDLEFDINIIFKENSFDENFINEICNLKQVSSFEKGLLKDFKIEKHSDLKENIQKIAKGIVNKTLVLKNSYTLQEALIRLVQNWFTFDYKIKQNGDNLSDMSAGKKSLVLLKLLIELDKSSCPILLDQPEDDLDNRSIYYDLVQFIKTKKKERQIIIATHNPNLVVGADAECIIVANQHGDESKNKKYQFEYVQGSLENTFIDEDVEEVLYKQGIQEHVCDILEGGKTAFEKRKKKYNF